MGRQALTVSLPGELGEKLNAYSTYTERTKSWLIQKALEDYFENIEDLEIALSRQIDPSDETVTLNQARRELGFSN
jgi:RHH-type transcriptional regulator, rel operon repressor / antitoxin RelB